MVRRGELAKPFPGAERTCFEPPAKSHRQGFPLQTQRVGLTRATKWYSYFFSPKLPMRSLESCKVIGCGDPAQLESDRYRPLQVQDGIARDAYALSPVPAKEFSSPPGNLYCMEAGLLQQSSPVGH